jgi:hypothetical protein
MQPLPPRRKQSKEHTEQTRFVMRVRAFHPEVLCFAVPNGASVSASQRLRLVHEGMMAGAPDLLLFAASRPPLAIEMKTDKGKPSAEQLTMQVALTDRGVQACICHGADQAYEVMMAWLQCQPVQ